LYAMVSAPLLRLLPERPPIPSPPRRVRSLSLILFPIGGVMKVPEQPLVILLMLTMEHLTELHGRLAKSVMP